MAIINQLTELNQKAAARYHEQVTTQFSLKGIEIETHIAVADHAIGALHNMVQDVGADLVMLIAHGETGERRWPYGSIATSLIAHGNVPLMIIQDLTDNEVLPTHAEQAISIMKGH
jgi:nucleotide-binding universal stress UspA family protein